MYYYKAKKSFGAKDKKPLTTEYIVRSPKEITAERIKQGILVSLVNLRTGEPTREKINLVSEIIVKYDNILSTEEVGKVILEATAKFMSRLQKEIFG